MTDSGMKIDLHMHTTVSDGTDRPEEIPAIVEAAGIGVFSVTDHDDVRGARILSSLTRSDGPKFITGIELSAEDADGKYHILGYGFDPDSPSVTAAAGRSHDMRMRKVTSRIDLLRSEFGIVFPEEEIGALLALDNPGKPHIGNLMVKYGYAGTVSDAITGYLNRLDVEEEHLAPEEAISAILEGSGIPVLAHPFFGSGEERITGEKMEARLVRLVGCGLRGIEAYYSGFDEGLRSEALLLAGKYGLYVTAGSDYHGRNKSVKPGYTGLEPSDGYPAGLVRFLELFF